MLKALKCDLQKVILSGAFAASVLATFALCFSTGVYADGKGQSYSVIEAMLNFKRDFMLSKQEFCSLAVMKGALSGYSAMFLPITAAFPFAYIYCRERLSGQLRLSIFRTKRAAFYCSKFVGAVLCGGLGAMLATAMFTAFAMISFPDVSNYGEWVAEFLAPNGVAAEVLKKLLSAFLYGCASALPAFLMCSFCKNLYIVICVPFLLKFMQDTALQKVCSNASDFTIYEKTAPFESGAAAQIPYFYADKTRIIAIIVLVIAAAAALFGYAFIMERRADKGE